AQENDTTGWNEFQLRMYDARFGRWLSVDPYGQFASPYVGMGNAPNMGVDPDGGWSWVTAGIGFAVGAAVGYAVGGDWQSALLGGLAGGALGGLSFNQSRDLIDVGVRSQNSVLKIEPSGIVAGVGDFLQTTDLFPKALSFSKTALSSIARRQAEEYFVRKNFDNPDFLKLRKYYSRYEDPMGTEY